MRALTGACVLDFTATAAGAWTARLLAELGAQVIRPAEADVAPASGVAEELRWRLRHRGKRIVPGSSGECARRYGGVCDLIVADDSPGWTAARATGAVVVALRHGLGSTALLGDEPMPDYALSATGGLTFITGDPQQAPVTPRDLIATRLAALHTACIACAALLRPAPGTVIDVLIQETVAASLESTLPIWFVDQQAVGRALNLHDLAWPVAAYQARDGWLGISCGRIEDTRRLLSVLGLERLISPSVTDFVGLGNAGDITRIDGVLARCVRGHAAAELVTACQRERIAAAVAARPADLLTDEQAVARGFTARWADGTPLFCNPVTETPIARTAPPPPLMLGGAGPVHAAVRAAAPGGTPPGSTAPGSTAPGGTALLAGIRVLDLTWALAGPFATMLLADLGADVAKVESSSHVDSSRLVVPYLGFADIERSGYFRFFNRNKRSIELDLGRQRGDVLALAARANVVVENLRPGSLDGKGLGYQHLRAQRRDLALCSISGFGRSGPRSAWASYGGAMAECANGLAMATGRTRPISPARALGDIFAGLYAALGVCAQLYQQDRRGTGGHIEVTQFEAGASALEEMLVLPPQAGEEHQVIGSDSRGWRAAGPAGEWAVHDAGWVAAALEKAGAVQRFSTAEGEDAFIRFPALAAGERPVIRRRSPRLGEHSAEVLGEWLG